jgi:hypothetical protein
MDGGTEGWSGEGVEDRRDKDKESLNLVVCDTIQDTARHGDSESRDFR